MTRDISAMRQQYSNEPLDFDSVAQHPFDEFNHWFDEACNAEVMEANAMTLATVDENGHADARVVLLKELDGTGFVFLYQLYQYQSHTAERQSIRMSGIFLAGVGKTNQDSRQNRALR